MQLQHGTMLNSTTRRLCMGPHWWPAHSIRARARCHAVLAQAAWPSQPMTCGSKDTPAAGPPPQRRVWQTTPGGWALRTIPGDRLVAVIDGTNVAVPCYKAARAGERPEPRFRAWLRFLRAATRAHLTLVAFDNKGSVGGNVRAQLHPSYNRARYRQKTTGERAWRNCVARARLLLHLDSQCWQHRIGVAHAELPPRGAAVYGSGAVAWSNDDPNQRWRHAASWQAACSRPLSASGHGLSGERLEAKNHLHGMEYGPVFACSHAGAAVRRCSLATSHAQHPVVASCPPHNDQIKHRDMAAPTCMPQTPLRRSAAAVTWSVGVV